MQISEMELLNYTRTKEAIRRHVSKLNATIEPTGLILDRLFEEKIIGNKDKYAIEKLPSREDRARRLMYLLFETSNPKALFVFNQVLQEIPEHEWLAHSIDVERVKDDVREDIKRLKREVNPRSGYNFLSTDNAGIIEKEIQTIEFLLRNDIHLELFGLRAPISEKLRCEISLFCGLIAFKRRSLQSLTLFKKISNELYALYMIVRLLCLSWNDYESKAARFHFVNKITKLIDSAGIRVTASVQRKVDNLVDEVMSIAITDAKADGNSIRYSRNLDDNYGTNECCREGNVKLYGVSTEHEHLRAQLVSNRKMFSKKVQTLVFRTNVNSLPSLDLNKLEHWKPLMDELQSVSQSLIDDVRKQLEEIYTLCLCLGAAWNDYESSEAEFSFVHDIIQSIDDAGSPITESLQDSMTAIVKEVMSKAIADAKADWNSTESPDRGQAEENKEVKRKSNVEKGDKIKRKVSHCATNGYFTD